MELYVRKSLTEPALTPEWLSNYSFESYITRIQLVFGLGTQLGYALDIEPMAAYSTRFFSRSERTFVRFEFNVNNLLAGCAVTARRSSHDTKIICSSAQDIEGRERANRFLSLLEGDMKLSGFEEIERCTKEAEQSRWVDSERERDLDRLERGNGPERPRFL